MSQLLIYEGVETGWQAGFSSLFVSNAGASGTGPTPPTPSVATKTGFRRERVSNEELQKQLKQLMIEIRDVKKKIKFNQSLGSGGNDSGTKYEL